MRPDQQLIDRFNKGECTPDEEKLVMDWLLASGGEAEEWTEIPLEGEYPAEYPAEMLAFIKANTFNGPAKIVASERQPDGLRVSAGNIHTLRRQWIAAACILLVACVSFLLWNKGKRADKVMPAIAAGHQERPVMISGLTIVNAQAQQQSTLRLADGSTVVLSPGASLRYDSLAYDRKDRVLYLSGQAVFTVAAEKNKPFSVNANGFSTTALGTSFMVTTRSSDAIQVRLYSGKVVIRHTVPFSKPMQDVYLKPGEELVYNSNAHQSFVSRYESPNDLPARAGHIRKDIRISGDTLVFHNAPLADVLDLLCKRYHVHIQYDRHILSDVYFTGQALPGDAIELLLKTVTRINNLTLIAAGDGFIIK